MGLGEWTGHNGFYYLISRLVGRSDGLWAEFVVRKFAANNFLKQIGWAKWPITINFGNNLSRNTVPEQYRDLPL